MLPESPPGGTAAAKSRLDRLHLAGTVFIHDSISQFHTAWHRHEAIPERVIHEPVRDASISLFVHDVPAADQIGAGVIETDVHELIFPLGKGVYGTAHFFIRVPHYGQPSVSLRLLLSPPVPGARASAPALALASWAFWQRLNLFFPHRLQISDRWECPSAPWEIFLPEARERVILPTILVHHRATMNNVCFIGPNAESHGSRSC